MTLRYTPERNRKIALARTTHGMIKTPTYASWVAMKHRCNSSKNKSTVKNYYARGIKYCERWEVFVNFLADMGERPDGTTLDRIDSDKGYEPANCQWSTRAVQNQNRRGVKLTKETANSILQSAEKDVVLAKIYGVTPRTIGRTKNGDAWD
jgi:hypothetical protein